MCYSRLVQISAVFCLLTVGLFSPAICPSPAVRCCHHSRVFASWRLFTGLVHRCLETVPSRLTLPFSSSQYWSSFSFHNKVCRDESSFSAHSGTHGDCMWGVLVIAYGLCRCSLLVFCAGHILLFGLFPSIPAFPYHGKTSAYHANQHWTGHKVNTRLAWIYSDAFSP